MIVSAKSIALRGFVRPVSALAIALNGLTPIRQPTPPEPKPIGVYGAPYDPPRPVNPHARISSLAEIASNPWRQSALLERAYREDEELLQIVEELVRHLQ